MERASNGAVAFSNEAHILQGNLGGINPIVLLHSDPLVSASDSQWWEPDVKSIQVSLLGCTAGEEWCKVDLEGPGKLASHP